MKWKFWVRAQPCTYCGRRDRVVRIKVNRLQRIWCCPDHVNDALNDIIRHWRQVKL